MQRRPSSTIVFSGGGVIAESSEAGSSSGQRQSSEPSTSRSNSVQGQGSIPDLTTLVMPTEAEISTRRKPYRHAPPLELVLIHPVS